MAKPYKLGKVIWIDPKSVKRLSTISGCLKTRLQRIKERRLTLHGIHLNGRWDINATDIYLGTAFKDFLNFKSNLPTIYDWKSLYEKIQTVGYIQDHSQRHIEIGIARSGELLLVDGRHRLICAQILDICEVPVEIVLIHKDFKGNLQ